MTEPGWCIIPLRKQFVKLHAYIKYFRSVGRWRSDFCPLRLPTAPFPGQSATSTDSPSFPYYSPVKSCRASKEYPSLTPLPKLFHICQLPVNTGGINLRSSKFFICRFSHHGMGESVLLSQYLAIIYKIRRMWKPCICLLEMHSVEPSLLCKRGQRGDSRC